MWTTFQIPKNSYTSFASHIISVPICCCSISYLSKADFKMLHQFYLTINLVIYSKLSSTYFQFAGITSCSTGEAEQNCYCIFWVCKDTLSVWLLVCFSLFSWRVIPMQREELHCKLLLKSSTFFIFTSFSFLTQCFLFLFQLHINKCFLKDSVKVEHEKNWGDWNPCSQTQWSHCQQMPGYQQAIMCWKGSFFHWMSGK